MEKKILHSWDLLLSRWDGSPGGNRSPLDRRKQCSRVPRFHYNPVSSQPGFVTHVSVRAPRPIAHWRSHCSEFQRSLHRRGFEPAMRSSLPATPTRSRPAARSVPSYTRWPYPPPNRRGSVRREVLARGLMSSASLSCFEI